LHSPFSSVRVDPIIGLGAFIAGGSIAAMALRRGRRRGPALGLAMALEVLLLGSAAIAAIPLGALTGALPLRVSLSLPIAAAALITLAVLLAHASLKRS
jgi:hypothetical protein